MAESGVPTGRHRGTPDTQSQPQTEPPSQHSEWPSFPVHTVPFVQHAPSEVHCEPKSIGGVPGEAGHADTLGGWLAGIHSSWVVAQSSAHTLPAPQHMAWPGQYCSGGQHSPLSLHASEAGHVVLDAGTWAGTHVVSWVMQFVPHVPSTTSWLIVSAQKQPPKCSQPVKSQHAPATHCVASACHIDTPTQRQLC